MDETIPSPPSSIHESNRSDSAGSRSSKGSKHSSRQKGSQTSSRRSSRQSSRRNSRISQTDNVEVDIGAGGDAVKSKEAEKGVKFHDGVSETESDGEIRRTSDTSSVTLDTPGDGCARPKIARGFRPELEDDFSHLMKRAVSFDQKAEMGKPGGLKIRTYDGREVILVTIDTQTDWEWLQKVDEEEKTETEEIVAEPQEKVDTEPEEEPQVITTPYTPYSDEYGIPIMDVSTDSDSSDEESWKKHQDQNYLPSIGPPQILQYLRESDKAEQVDFPTDEFGRPYGMFGGTCEFCGQEIKPFPTLERQQEVAPDELYCCDEYRDFVQFATTTAVDLEEELRNKQKQICIKPHAHFGTKKDRKAAKERAVQRMRDRELQRRQQEAQGMQQNLFSSAGAGSHGGGAHPPSRAALGPKSVQQPPNFAGQFRGGPMPIDVTRQMKTINYQLSSQRCLDEGWTLRPPSPLLKEEEVLEVFIPEPLIESGKLVDRPLIQKYYENGRKFLTIFSDGSGNVFYPSGQLAIAITSVSLGLYTYILHDDTPDHKVCAIFEPNGYGSCFHDNGVVRIYFDQLGGMELYPTGARRKSWTWRDPEVHVHAPPFQPICFGLNHYIGVRIMSQDNITVTMLARKRSCRFNVGSKLKLVAPENLPRKEIDENMLYLNEKAAYVENVLHKVSTLLKFPKSPKLDKILPPLHVTAKMQRCEKQRKERKVSSSEEKPQLVLPTVKVS